MTNSRQNTNTGNVDKWNKGRTVFETLLVISFVMILLACAFSYIHKAVRITKEYALITELSNIRTSIFL